MERQRKEKSGGGRKKKLRGNSRGSGGFRRTLQKSTTPTAPAKAPELQGIRKKRVRQKSRMKKSQNAGGELFGRKGGGYRGRPKKKEEGDSLDRNPLERKSTTTEVLRRRRRGRRKKKNNMEGGSKVVGGRARAENASWREGIVRKGRKRCRDDKLARKGGEAAGGGSCHRGASGESKNEHGTLRRNS